MAVHDRTYRRYTGPMTRPGTRFLVLARSCFRDIFRPRLFTALFTASLAFPLACALLIYVQHNLSLLKALPFEVPRLIAIDARFFLAFLWIQTSMAFVLALVVMPAILAPDLVNGALPLYLSRPLTRRSYLLGKVFALVVLLSAVTWVPGSALYALEGSLAGDGWLWRNARLLGGINLASFTAIVAMGLPALAISVHQRSKSKARATLVSVLFASTAAGQILSDLLETPWGEALIAAKVLDVVYQRLLGAGTGGELPLWGAFAVIGLACGASLLVIDRRLRAFQVIA